MKIAGYRYRYRWGWLVGIVFLLNLTTLWASPKIGCANTEYDFGIRESGNSVEGTFTINNDGDQALEISRVLTRGKRDMIQIAHNGSIGQLRRRLQWATLVPEL